MKKLLKGFLVLSLFAVGVKAATNKTFTLPRSHGVNLAMEYTTWNELLQTKDDDRFGANFQIVPFYQDSSESDGLGKYFGYKNLNVFNIKSINHVVSPFDAAKDIDYQYVTHRSVDIAHTNAQVKYDPEQEAYGVRIDYYQDLEKILTGLYLKVVIPIVHVENDMRLSVTADTGFLGAKVNGLNKVIRYFNGDYSVAAGEHDAQKALTHAKMKGDNDTTGVADIDIVLGYKFLDKEKYHMSINLGLTIPTGDDADGDYLFEAIVGNGNHWALGFGLDFGAKLWEDGDQNIKIAAAMNYRYLFESTEKRTIGFTLEGLPATANSLTHYFVIAKPDGTQNYGTPAANILTRDLDVEPGSQIDALLMFTYNNGGFNFDLGYNFFWKDSEDVSVKSWTTEDEKWAVIAQDYDFAAVVPTPAVDGDYATGAYATSKLTKARLDVGRAGTPSQDTHKLFGGLGYIFKEWEYPLMLNISGHYEWADAHSDGGIENWGIWGKLGVAF